MKSRKKSRRTRLKASDDRTALLLAGGDGTRLNDLTREITGEPIPKQYCRLYENASLLEATLARTMIYTSTENTYIIINKDHTDLALSQVQRLPGSNIFIQPANRDTGPGLILSLLELNGKKPNAIVAVFPTDHYIDNDRSFIEHIFRATRLIERMPDKVAILGITPDRLETGYGYLIPESPVKAFEKTYYVKSFCEKPGLSKAYEAITLGGLWNTFVMVFKLENMIKILKQLVPDRFRAMTELLNFPHEAEGIYRNLEPWNFSTEVLTHISEHIIILEIDDIRWSDWGTRESIERTYRQLNRQPYWIHPLHQPIQAGSDSSNRLQKSQSIA